MSSFFQRLSKKIPQISKKSTLSAPYNRVITQSAYFLRQKYNPVKLCIFLSDRFDGNKGKWQRSMITHRVSHLHLFATLNKERNSSYLQLSRRLNGKMLVFWLLYSKSIPIVQQINAKKPTCQTIAFFTKY